MAFVRGRGKVLINKRENVEASNVRGGKPCNSKLK
jgi:hypothetical protein